MSALEAQISSLTSDKGALQLELSTTCHDLTEVRGDAAKYAESASETMSNYQRELSQHGKTMNELLAIKDQVIQVLLYSYISLGFQARFFAGLSPFSAVWNRSCSLYMYVVCQ